MVLKGFVFSADAVVALLLVVAAFTVLTALTENMPYSRLYQYDQHYYLESVAGTVKHHPLFQDVVSSVLDGRVNRARSRLRSLLRNVGGSQTALSAEVRVYNETGQVGSVRASWPANRWPGPTDTVATATVTFAYGDYVGTVKVFSW